MKKQTAILVDWHQTTNTGIPVLSGTVFEHPKIADGTLITTSPIVKLDVANGICETRNTIYTLREPSNETSV